MSRIGHDRSHVGLRSSSSFWCYWCGSKKNLRRCGRCHNAFYCCKEHQRQHWKVHKDNCLDAIKRNDNMLSGSTQLATLSRSAAAASTRIGNFQFNPTPKEISILEAEQNVDMGLMSLMNDSGLPLDLNLKDSDFGAFEVNPSDAELFDEEVLTRLINGDMDFTDKALITDDRPTTCARVSSSEISEVVSSRPNNVVTLQPNAVGESDNQYSNPTSYQAECNLLNDLNFDELNASINECLDLASYHYGVSKSDNQVVSNSSQSDTQCNNAVTTKPEIRKTDKRQRQSLIENWENRSPGKTGRKPIVHEVVNLCESRTDSWFVEMNAEPATKLSAGWLEQVCSNIVEDMNNFGICVIDNFLGLKSGEMILDEVKALYGDGHFREGQLVSSKKQCSPQTIRGDSITWVDGTEENCHNIGHLIHTLDAIVMKSTNMESSGLLKKHRINRRTKAMIACYPGNGTRYVKHVDNPNQDGRCITSIYYLNKNWDIKRHGGLLRMFPVGHNNHVANIEPVFDRILFFWSDRRNPHEVQPAFAVRFAITVWYCDSNERSQAVRHHKQGTPN